MLTTSSGPQDRQRCLAAGAKQFLTKLLSYHQFPLAQQLIQEWKLT
jgi:CheY-like chemotaxis protein